MVSSALIGVNDEAEGDPAHDWRDLIDEQFLPDVARWHRGLNGEPHVTAEELERLETDIQTAKSWTGGGT